MSQAFLHVVAAFAVGWVVMGAWAFVIARKVRRLRGRGSDADEGRG